MTIVMSSATVCKGTGVRAARSMRWAKLDSIRTDAGHSQKAARVQLLTLLLAGKTWEMKV